MQRWFSSGMVVLALALLSSCSNEKEEQALKAIITKQEADLANLQKRAESLSTLKQEHDQLEKQRNQLVGQDLGSDPKAKLKQSIPLASNVTDTQGRPGMYDVVGNGKPMEILAQLAQLGRVSPGLTLSYLAISPTGWAIRLESPKPPPAPPPVKAPPPPTPPTLPEKGPLPFGRGEADKMRAQIDDNQKKMADVTQSLGEVGSLTIQNQALHAEIAKASMSDRLPSAVESATLIFAGPAPALATGDITFQGNGLEAKGPDKGPKDKTLEKAMPILQQHFTVQKVDRGAQVVLHLAKASTPPPMPH
jgi:hypothetical protein